MGKASQGWKYTERWGSGLNRNGEGSGLGLDWGTELTIKGRGRDWGETVEPKKER